MHGGVVFSRNKCGRLLKTLMRQAMSGTQKQCPEEEFARRGEFLESSFEARSVANSSKSEGPASTPVL